MARDTVISKPFLERVTAPWMEVHHCIQVFTGLKINDGDMIEYVRTCVLQRFFFLTRIHLYIYLFIYLPDIKYIYIYSIIVYNIMILYMY